MTGEVHKLAQAPQHQTSSGGGGDFDNRFRTLEIQVARIDERVTSIQEDMARKNDITGLKVWILVGVLSAIGVAATISAIVVKAFF